MNASELVGFLITILVLLIALTRRLREEKFRREHPEEYAEKVKKEEEAYKAFLRSLDIPIEEEGPPQMKKKRPKAPPPPPTSAAAQGAYVPRSTVAEGF
ncbi:MAG: hypothetical protein KDK78_04515, partial [Chlamydiia bacterium]|nr:hypothetical protein [Chlamydiia bacterium]